MNLRCMRNDESSKNVNNLFTTNRRSLPSSTHELSSVLFSLSLSYYLNFQNIEMCDYFQAIDVEKWKLIDLGFLL